MVWIDSAYGFTRAAAETQSFQIFVSKDALALPLRVKGNLAAPE